jgi:hypothetical protein
MIVRVVYKNDGTVAVIIPAIKSKKPQETEDAWLERVFGKAMDGNLSGLPFDDIDESELPPRENRNAWTGSKGHGVSVDQAKIQAQRTAKTRKDLIDAEKEKMLEEQAISSLKAQGKL